MTVTNQAKAEPTALALSPSTIAVNSQLEALRKDGAHILQAGVIQRDIPLHEIVVSPYQIRLVQDGQFFKSPDKEVYFNKGEYSLTRVAYDRFAQRACIQWVWRECKRIPPLNNPRYCAYRAVGKMMDLSGRWRVQSAEKAIDMDIVEQELRDNYRQKAQGYMEGTSQKDRDFQRAFPNERDRSLWVEEKVRIDALQIQKHILARAQTGAQNRVIQKLLALKASYTKAELDKPFVFAALIFRPDPNHPMDRQYLLDQGSGMANMLYDTEKTEREEEIEMPEGKIINVTSYPLTALDEDVAEEVRTPEPSRAASPANVAPDQPAPSKAENLRIDFKNMEVAEQVKTLNDLITQKAYKGKVTGDMSKWKAEQRLQFFDVLDKMPTVGKTVDEPLPFQS